MIRLLRELRLIPIMLIAAGCLFGLKVFGLLFNGNYLLGARTLTGENAIAISLSPTTQELTPQTIPLENWAKAPVAKQSWMREMFGFPDVTGSVNAPAPPAQTPVTVTGSSAAPKPAPKEGKSGDKAAAAPPGANNQPPAVKPSGTQIPLDGNRQLSAAERAILERLQERRQELDKRARELDMRETMLKESEQRLDARMNELKELEARVGTGAQQKEKAENARFKSLATMYENMKAKDAAKIFDRLDIKVLIDMASQINPRRMSEILAQMSPDAAERLTNELASRANGGEKTQNPAALPKIEGRPSGT
jgi:flagellar motility protein MotE (MotC chaperone)